MQPTPTGPTTEIHIVTTQLTPRGARPSNRQLTINGLTAKATAKIFL